MIEKRLNNQSEKYNLLSQLDNELILINDIYIIRYSDKLYYYDLQHNLIKSYSYRQYTIKALKELIKYAKNQGDKKTYNVNYFNLSKQSIELFARSKKQAKLKFGRLFDLNILNITCKTA